MPNKIQQKNESIFNYVVLTFLFFFMFINLVLPEISSGENSGEQLYNLLFIGPGYTSGGVVIYQNHNDIQASHTPLSLSYTSKNKTVSISNLSSFGPITGYSMRPTFFAGNTVLYSNYTGQKLKEGQIISYTSQDGEYLVVHRISAVYPEFVITQGDYLNNKEYVKYNRIKEVVVGVLYT